MAGEDGALLGMVTDGDIRRAILRGCRLSEAIRTVMNAAPHALPAGTPRAEVLSFMRRHKFHQVPLVDGQGRLAGLELLDRLIGVAELPNSVVVMAGGRGTRLRPLTEDCPKPMLPVGGKPILEHILEAFIEEGFRKFFFSVNYMAETITAHFGSGEAWGARIEYLRESSPLGHCRFAYAAVRAPASSAGGHERGPADQGELCLDAGVPRTAWRVGHDGGSRIRPRDSLWGRHGRQWRSAGIRRKRWRKDRAHRRKAGAALLRRMPESTFSVPNPFDHLPTETPFDMPMLFDRLRQAGATMAFPLRDYWVDVGRHDELEMAKDDLARAQSRATLPDR